MKPLVRRFLVATILASSAMVAVAASGGMTETVLPNGMRVVLRPVDTNPVVCSAVLVRAGVAWEPDGLSGASHFLEHLLFNGTGTRTQEQLYADVDRIGAYNNATTRADHTLYFLLAPKEHLDAVLEIQADMLLHSTLPPDKFEKEKGIVREEMERSGHDPSNEADEFFNERIFAGTPYARPVLGTIESIEALQRDDVLAYYHDRYVPSRMVLLLTGDFDPDTALRQIWQRFTVDATDPGDELKPDVEMPPAEHAFGSPPPIQHQRLEAGRTYVRAAFPAPAEDDPDAAVFGLLVELLSGGSGSPLARALEGGSEPLVFDHSLYYSTTGGKGMLAFSASLTGARPAGEVVALARQTIIDAVRDRLLDPEDLRLLNESQLTEDVTLEEQVHYYALFRAPRFLQTTAAELAERKARRAEAGVDAFGVLIDRYLQTGSGVVTVSGPEETDGAVGMVRLDRGAGSPAAAGEAAAGARTVVLDNGLTLSVATQAGSAVFAAHLIARNRSALEPEERAGLADLVHRLLLRGTLARDAAGVDQELQGIGASVKFHDDARFPFDDYRTSPTYSFAMLETRTEKSSEALRLLAEIIQTPRFDAAEIDKATGRMRDLAQRESESSRSASGQLFRGLVAPGLPLSRPVSGTATSLEGVTRDDVVQFHEKLFAPDNLILTLRGGGEPEAVLRRATEIFGGPGPGGGWAPAAQAGTEPRAATALTTPPPVTEKASRGGEELNGRQSYLRLGAVVAVSADDLPALAVANLVLSDRLQMDLRETQGLAYSIGSGLATLGRGRQLVVISMGTAADNLERAETEIRRVVGELRKEPAEVEEIARVVAARRGRILMRRLPSQNQAYYDGLRLLYGEATGGDLDYLEALGSVSPQQVQAAARRYLDPDGWVVATVR